MADKLEWMNKHFVLMRYQTVKETIEKEKYKLRPDLQEFVTENMRCEDFVYALQEAEKHKEACDFLAYIMHKRAAVWWVYSCLLLLNEELEVTPAVERDLESIGKPKEMPIPEWAKMPPPSPEEIAQEAAADKAQNDLEKLIAEMSSTADECKKIIPQEIQQLWDNAFEVTKETINKEYNVNLDSMLADVSKHLNDPLFEIDPNSPIFKAESELRSTIEAQRKEIVDLLKSVTPPKMPEHQKKMRDNAMQAVYRWIVAPDEVNSADALEIGNQCPDMPAGLLAMSAFWSFGNLMPEGKQVVVTPAGLAANGLCATILNAALTAGGTRKYKERCQLYLEEGLKVIWGESNWGEAVEEKVPPHEQEPEISLNSVEKKPRVKYSKWNAGE